MKVIITAMHEEYEVLLQTIPQVIKIKNSFLEIHKGDINGPILLVKCGIGKVNAAMATQYVIDTYQPDCIFGIGVAGALDDTLKIEDLIIASYVMQHDMDVTALGFKKGEIPYSELSQFHCDNKLIKLAIDVCNTMNYSYLHGPILSGDQFIIDKSTLAPFNALAVEMEGASIGQVAHLNALPFLIVRCISDQADGKAPDSFSDFLTKSSKQVANLIIQILTSL